MQTKTVSLLLPAIAAVSGFAPVLTATASTITVNSTLDTIANDGACTLREAIIAANTNAASSDTSNGCAAGDAPVDTIAFHIPDADSGCTGAAPKVCTITITSATPSCTACLPDITAPVLIDGYTQPNASANTLAIGDDATILIRINASNVTGASALHLAGGSTGSTVRGLSIVKAGGDADNLGYLLTINSGSINNTIAGNFIGVEPDGATVSTNHVVFAALEIANSGGNTIGGAASAARNLIATGAGNGIAVNIESNSATNVVQGNYVDLDAAGSQGIGNASIGINIAAGGNTVGGSGAGEGNVIGTWGTVGLQFAFGGAGGAVSGKGNLIGTDATGTVALAAGAYGVFIGGSTDTVTVGGSAAGEGNLIHGTVNGIWVNGDAAVGKTPKIQGNHINVSLDGSVPFPSVASGIVVSAGLGGTIGGEGPGEGNVITASGANAITVSFAKDWSFLGNSMYNNGFGISLGSADVKAQPVPNDTDDADTGPNNRQNYPVLSGDVLLSKTSMHISGSLNSEASKTYRIEFFANAGCDLTGHGQGKIFLPLAVPLDVTTSPNDVAFGPISLTTPKDRHVITATATDPDGNTSEFSDCSQEDTIFSDGVDGD